LLPPACDEFLYYDNLEGVEPHPSKDTGGSASSTGATSGTKDKKGSHGHRKAKAADPGPVPAEPEQVDSGGDGHGDEDGGHGCRPDLAVLVAQTLSGLQTSQAGEVTASVLKRTLVRKDPTFSEADYGFRAFGELLRHLAD